MTDDNDDISKLYAIPQLLEMCKARIKSEAPKAENADQLPPKMYPLTHCSKISTDLIPPCKWRRSILNHIRFLQEKWYWDLFEEKELFETVFRYMVDFPNLMDPKEDHGPKDTLYAALKVLVLEGWVAFEKHLRFHGPATFLDDCIYYLDQVSSVLGARSFCERAKKIAAESKFDTIKAKALAESILYWMEVIPVSPADKLMVPLKECCEQLHLDCTQRLKTA